MITLKLHVEYAGDDKEFKKIPSGYIDKTVCGCGMSSVALENDVDTVIAVPTIYLARNKAQQYPNERTNNELLAVWGDTRKEDIDEYLERVKVIKIICTYDSLPKVEYLLEKCHLVIDESNELLSLTKLKPEVIDEVFNIAHKYKETVSFISATPTPLEYMPKWVGEIEQVKIEWSDIKKVIPIT